MKKMGGLGNIMNMLPGLEVWAEVKLKDEQIDEERWTAWKRLFIP